MKTKEEIDALKREWTKDPCRDLEATDGFEEHESELLAFRHEQEAKWKAEREEAGRHSWELVFSDMSTSTYRMKVFGGWLVQCTRTVAIDVSALTTTFLADPEHQWHVTPVDIGNCWRCSTDNIDLTTHECAAKTAEAK